MTARAKAARLASELDEAGVLDPRFEAELLVRQAANLTRSQFFANPRLTDEAADRLERLRQRRLQREPMAYLAGTREFFGLEFIVSGDVLIPRPETEMLVELGLEVLKRQPRSAVVDVGTGSGAVAISVAANSPGASVIGLDVSPVALQVARLNARRLAPRVGMVRGTLLTAVRQADIVLANLPYIPTGDIEGLMPEVRDWEPRVALDGGNDGLWLVRPLIADCGSRIRPRLLAMEVGRGQAESVAAIGRGSGARVEVLQDLVGIDRVVCLRWE